MAKHSIPCVSQVVQSVVSGLEILCYSHHLCLCEQEEYLQLVTPVWVPCSPSNRTRKLFQRFDMCRWREGLRPQGLVEEFHHYYPAPVPIPPCGHEFV